MMMKFLAAAALLLAPFAALAQGIPTFHSGVVTPGHIAKYTAPGRITDAGGISGDANGIGVSALAATGTGKRMCVNSAATTGAYDQLCMQADDGTGKAVISLEALGGAPLQALYFRINGSDYNVASALAPAGAAVVSSLTTNLISATSGPLHMSQGGAVNVAASVYTQGDFLWIESADPSLYTQLTFAGTPTAAETPGIRFTLAAVNYDFRHTVVGGDTNTSIALGVCNALYNAYTNNTGGFKTALNNTVDGQGQGMGNPVQTSCAGQVLSGVLYIDTPYVGGQTATALATANTTVTICSGALGCPAAPTMDGGPVVNITRWYPVGWTRTAGDLGPYVNFQDRVGAGGYTQIGFLDTVYGNSAWTMEWGLTSGGAKIGIAADRVTISKPIVMTPAAVAIAGPSIGTANTGELTVTGGLLGVQFNKNDNTVYTFKVSNTGAAQALTSLAVNGAIIGGHQFTAHVGVDQNITMVTTAGVANLAALNDAGNAVVPLRLNASEVISPAPMWIKSGLAIPAGGVTGEGYKFSTETNFGVFFGSGVPTLSAAKGSLYLRSDGSSTTTRAYINTDGGTTWTALTTAA